MFFVVVAAVDLRCSFNTEYVGRACDTGTNSETGNSHVVFSFVHLHHERLRKGWLIFGIIWNCEFGERHSYARLIDTIWMWIPCARLNTASLNTLASFLFFICANALTSAIHSFTHDSLTSVLQHAAQQNGNLSFKLRCTVCVLSFYDSPFFDTSKLIPVADLERYEVLIWMLHEFFGREICSCVHQKLIRIFARFFVTVRLPHFRIYFVIF